MITFLPYKDFVLSAKVLDPKRLGKQRGEVLILLEALIDPKNKTHRHPACKMWWGYRDALVAYGLAICEEYSNRGYEENTYKKILAFSETPTQNMPRWLGNEAFHSSHRGNLLRKMPEWYKYFWDDSPLLPYIWPENYDQRLLLRQDPCLTK